MKYSSAKQIKFPLKPRTNVLRFLSLMFANIVTQLCIIILLASAFGELSGTTGGLVVEQIKPRNMSESEFDRAARFANVTIVPDEPAPMMAIGNDTFEPIYCDLDVDCDEISNSVCVDSQCRCATNYRLSVEHETRITCQLFKCEANEDCQEWDSNLVCSPELHTCVCRADYFGSHMDKRCHQLSGSMNWLLLIAIAPIVILVLVCVFWCVRLARTSVRLRETAASVKRRLSTFSIKSKSSRKVNITAT